MSRDEFNQLEKYLKSIYKTDARRVRRELSTYALTLKKVKHSHPNPHWYKFIDLYFIYPDGVIYDKKKSPLQNIIMHIPYVQKLGCDALHILPFLESPMVDRGFDISDFHKVRHGLGNQQELQRIISEAEKSGIRVFMDLVLNHVSDQHMWFQNAQKGDEHFRKFFIYEKTQPNFIRKFHKDNAVWAEYRVNSKKITINIAFPEHAGEIPHWREGSDGYWYYHTYYPQQPDLNWDNADVFIEIGKILLYWAAMGFNFRLDAIPFVGKAAYKETDIVNHETHMITASLLTLAKTVHEECAFIVETYETLDTVIDYFGTTNRVEANLAYNFHLCTSLWVSIVTKEAKNIWYIFDKLHSIPKHAAWINFLRNHDELSLAYLGENLTKSVRKELLPKGANFREGYGISGRTFSLLGKNEKRFLMAYFLLSSLPGGMALPYGDEVAIENIPLKNLSKSEQKDTRNINRGTFSSKQFKTKQARNYSERFAYMLEKRGELREYLNVWPEKTASPPHVFSACYKLGTSELRIYVNLSGKATKISLKDLHDSKMIANINDVTIDNKQILLGAYGGVWLQK